MDHLLSAIYNAVVQDLKKQSSWCYHTVQATITIILHHIFDQFIQKKVVFPTSYSKISILLFNAMQCMRWEWNYLWKCKTSVRKSHHHAWTWGLYYYICDTCKAYIAWCIWHYFCVCLCSIFSITIIKIFT